MMNLHDIVMEGISSVFFDTITRLSNMRYFKAQEITPNHQRQEREIIKNLHKEVGGGVDGESLDPKLDYPQ
jgi:hypothetical protein